MEDRSDIRKRKLSRTKQATTKSLKLTHRARGGEYTFLIVTVVGSILLVVALLFVWYSQAASKNNLSQLQNVPDPVVPQPPSRSNLQKFTSAAVCSDGVPCSKIGRDILKEGGNAVDAAIGALLCNGIVNSQSMGIGGGFMGTIYMNKTAYAIIAREAAPLGAHRDMFVKDGNLSRTGGLAVGIPGELLGYWEMWQKFGILPWKDLVEPSIQLCRKGYVMSRSQHDSIFFRPNIFDNDPEFRRMFYDYENQDYYKIGTIVKAKKICETYEIIAKEGGMALNNGSLTKGFADDIVANGGIITEKDMRNYKVEWTDPVEFHLHGGQTLYSVPPPASGLLLGYILQVLDGFNLTAPYTNILDASKPKVIEDYVQILHRIIETFKFAFAHRSRLGDPLYVDIDEVKSELLSNYYAQETRQKIKDNRVPKKSDYYGSLSFTKDDHGTAHLSVLSSAGDAVSITSTINLYFGAGFISQSTGIFPNSVMDDFSTPGVENFFNLPPSKNNFIEPGKRPMSSACPTIMTDSNDQVSLVIGASGGTKIPTAIAWVILRHFWFDEDIKEAVDSSRIHHQLYPMKVEYEYGLTAQVVEGLRKLGHTMERYAHRGSIICGISKVNGTIYANADFRKGGEAYGF